MGDILSMFSEIVRMVIGRGTGEYRSGGKVSPLHTCISVSGLIVGLLATLTTTACTGSLAAIQAAATTEKVVAGSPDDVSSQLAIEPTQGPAHDSNAVSSATVVSTPMARPTPIPSPTNTIPPKPTSTPAPSLQQLTKGGCCAQPQFSPDGQQILFIDKPDQVAPVGIYGIEIMDPPTAPKLINEIIGFRSPDRTIVATMDGDLARFTHETSGQSWTVDTGGNWPRYSPDASQVLWVASDREGPYDRRQSDIWLADLDGSNRRLLLSTYGGGAAGWFPDEQRILMIGRDVPSDEKQTLFTYNLETGDRVDLFSHRRLRDAQISPGGSWIALFLTFSDDDEETENGLWVVSADGATRRTLDVPGFGAYRWRDDNTLLFIPMRTSAEDSMQLWAVDVSTNQNWPLTNPDTLFFSISNGDWNVSPDGRQVVFVNSADQNIWLMTVP